MLVHQSIPFYRHSTYITKENIDIFHIALWSDSVCRIKLEFKLSLMLEHLLLKFLLKLVLRRRKRSDCGVSSETLCILKKIFGAPTGKCRGTKWENAIFLYQTNFWSNLDKFLSETRKIYPYWTKSWSETRKNCNFPRKLQCTLEFLCRRPKKFFECI